MTIIKNHSDENLACNILMELKPKNKYTYKEINSRLGLSDNSTHIPNHSLWEKMLMEDIFVDVTNGDARKGNPKMFVFKNADKLATAIERSDLMVLRRKALKVRINWIRDEL